MVKLTKIYTRTGDDGSTHLGDLSRVDKHHARVEAYGCVDEANAAIGLAVAGLDQHPAIRAMLLRVQNDLFDVGADLCVPGKDDQKLRVIQSQVQWLEQSIDEVNADLEPLTSFILPGGTEASARLHVARCAVRQAERRAVQLMKAEPEQSNPRAITYLNRLSDLLFVLARKANVDNGGSGDVLWEPGSSQT